MSRSELLSKYVKLLVQLTLHFVLRKYNFGTHLDKKQIATSTTIVPEQPVIIKRRTNLEQFTILRQGPKIWNSLPVLVTHSSNLLSFKTKMQEFLNK